MYHKYIDMEIYPTIFDICIYDPDTEGDKEKIKKYIERKCPAILQEIPDYFSGSAFTLWCYSGKLFLIICVPYYKNSMCKTVRTLTHESLHAVNRIMENVGIEYSVDNDEAFAYLIGEVSSMIMETIEKGYKNAKTKKRRRK